MNDVYKGKTVIVTGGANGIGKEVALAFSREGAFVVVADIQEPIFEGEHPISYIKTDVSSEDDMLALFKEVEKRYKKVDILINNAGISAFKNFFDVKVSEWDQIMNTNLRSVFICTREAAKRMPPGSAVVNMASTRAGMSEPNTEAYAASKGGMVSLTHALAMTLAEKRIRVNCVSPGWIETKHYEELHANDHSQHPSGRVGKANDIARACLYLCADGNDFINGTNITIDGGMTKKMIYEE